MKPPLSSILHELNALKEYISAVEGVLASGRMPEMIGLEKRVSDICETIQNADDKTKKDCIEELKDFLNLLNTCEDNMRKFYHNNLGQPSSHDHP